MKDTVRPLPHQTLPRRSLPLLDRVGATGSLLCAIHCALLPLLIVLLPSLGIAAWLGEDFERGFVLFVTLLGVFTLGWGYRRHRQVRPLGLLLPGFAALWTGVLYTPLHHALLPHAITMTLGGMMVGLAHLTNLRLNHAFNQQAFNHQVLNQDGHVHDATCVR